MLSDWRGFLRAGLVSALALFCQSHFENNAYSQSIDWRGTLETEMAVGTDDGDIQKSDFVFRPELHGQFGSWGAFNLTGQVRTNPVGAYEPSNEGRGPLNRREIVGDRTELELLEAYIDIHSNAGFWRIGKQQVAWGQADGFQVLDVVNPRDFREFILGKAEDRRIPLWMVNYERAYSGATVQLLWVPDQTYNAIPSSGPFSFTSKRYAPAIPTEFDGRITIEEIDEPSRLLSDDDFGARLSGFHSGWDWSLNYLYSYGDHRVLHRHTEGLSELIIQPRYERTHLVGGSAANSFGKTTIRLEGGWRSDRFITVDQPANAPGVAQSGDFTYVVGADHQLDGDTVISAQLFQSHILKRIEGARHDRVDTRFSILARREFFNDAFRADALLIGSAADGDGVLQLSLRGDLNDAVTFSLGADIFFGMDEGLYGQFDDADRIRLRVSYAY